MPDIFASIVTFFIDHILGPVIILVGGAVAYILKHKFDKVSKEMVARDELADLEKETNIRRELMETIAQDVEAAVASNMQLAEALKQGGHKLTSRHCKNACT